MRGLLDLVFPFHLVVDRDLVVRGFGRSLARVCPAVAIGDRLGDHLCLIAAPAGGAAPGVLDASSLVAGPHALLLQARGSGLRLRCQVMRAKDLPADVGTPADGIVLLATPWLAGPDDLARSGLRLGDFAAHDATPDYAFVTQAQHAALDDARRLARRLEELEAARRHEALHDPLTGAGNRRWLRDRLGQAVSPALLLIDIDGFGEINDAYTATAGDRVLTEVVTRLRAVCPPGAAVARVGGDEFAILIDGPEAARECLPLAETVVDAMTDPVLHDGRSLPVSVTVGVVPAGEPFELQRNADVALFAAKQRGRGQVVAFDTQVHAALLHRIELRDRLARAVAEGGLSVVYQPIVSLATGTVYGFEALARWRDPVLGPVTPDVFIPIAEEAGLIGELGLAVARASAERIARWRARYPDADLRMSVNVAPRQLEAPDLAERLHAIVEQAGVPPHAYQLELTESAFTRHRTGAEQLGTLRAYGYPLAIDDFGSSESTLARLHTVPATVLKIDRAFLLDAVDAPDRATRLLRAVVAIADAFGMSTVAEGVETPTHADLVTSVGCTLGQGWLYARPLDDDAAEAWLAERLTPAERLAPAQQKAPAPGSPPVPAPRAPGTDVRSGSGTS